MSVDLQLDVEEFQQIFLDWYFKNHRKLPWRDVQDPYIIWVSEIMLQQTRVETVIDYFYRFMEKYPTIEDLANSDEMELLKIWEGLGYYSRSRNLRFAANQIMHDFGGVFPKTPKEIASLKGIGPYTAGAILSIAFHQPEPAIDGNIQRVTSRLFELSDDISKPQSRKTFDAVMRKIISHDFPGEFNQAMMDLGSGICKPKNPNCDICPIQAFCQSREHSTQLNFPVKSKKLKQKLIYYFAYAIQNEEGEYIIIQRPEEGLLSNMWTFPMELVTKDTYMSAQVQASTFTGSEQYPDYSITTKPVGEVTHIFSHLKWHILVFEGRQKNNFVLHDQANVWALPKDSKRSYPKPQQKIFELLKKRND